MKSNCAVLPMMAAILLGGALAAPGETAGQWPRFRGPNGTGVSEATTIPVQWSEQDYNFRIALPGAGHSSPVVWGRQVFLLSANPALSRRYILSIDADSGDLLWQRDFDFTPYPKHAFNSYATSTPAVDQDRLYIAWASPDETIVMALGHAGQTLWQRDLGPFVGRHGFGTSPMRYGGLVILVCQQQGERLKPGQAPGKSFVIALDCVTGATRWKIVRETTQVAYGTPCIYWPPAGPAEIICTSNANGLFSLDPQTGRENWALKVFSMRTVSSPLVAGGRIFGSTGSGGGGNYVVAVQPGTLPRELYRIERQSPYVPTCIARGDLLFLWSDRGIVSCLEAAAGKLLWRKRVGGNYFASPVRAAKQIYGVAKDGQVTVVAAERSFQLLGRSSLGEATRSTPAIANGRMYLRTESHLMSIGGR